jgi:hypothetical protein
MAVAAVARDEAVADGGDGVGSGGQSPRSIKTSHSRSWAGKGMDRLKRVRYQRVP